jgi:hypothetical protein
MDRATLAYLILALMLAVGAVAASLTHRFVRYDRLQRRGHHDRKPVWKPFWML